MWIGVIWFRWEAAGSLFNCHSVEAHFPPGPTVLTANGFMVLSFTLQHSLHGVKCVENLVSAGCQFYRDTGCSFTLMWQHLPPPLTRDVACGFYFFLSTLFFRWFKSTLLFGVRFVSVFVNMYDVFTCCAAFLWLSPSWIVPSAQLFSGCLIWIKDPNYLLLLNFSRLFSTSGLSSILFQITLFNAVIVKLHWIHK